MISFLIVFLLFSILYVCRSSFHSLISQIIWFRQFFRFDYFFRWILILLRWFFLVNPSVPLGDAKLSYYPFHQPSNTTRETKATFKVLKFEIIWVFFWGIVLLLLKKLALAFIDVFLWGFSFDRSLNIFFHFFAIEKEHSY